MVPFTETLTWTPPHASDPLSGTEIFQRNALRVIGMISPRSGTRAQAPASESVRTTQVISAGAAASRACWG